MAGANCVAIQPSAASTGVCCGSLGFVLIECICFCDLAALCAAWALMLGVVFALLGQHLVTAVDSSNLRPTYVYCRQRISIICASSWNQSGYIRKRSLAGLLRCQSHSYSCFSERGENGEEAGFNEEEESSRGQPSGRFPLHPIALLAQALAVFSSLRARLHLCRSKLEVLCEESEWEGFDGTVLKQGSLGMALLSTSIIARDRISPVLLTLRANPTFMSGLVAWAIAQVLFPKFHSTFAT